MAKNKELIEKANKLISEAERIKEEDPNRSINLIKEAIKIRPDYLLYDYFLLIRYLTKLENFGKAKKIFTEMINRLDKNNIYSYNTVLSEIYENKCNLLFSQKKWKEFIYCYLSADYNKVIGLCSQGKGESMIEIIMKAKSFDEYFILNNLRLNRALKMLNAENEKELLFSAYIKFLKTKIADLDYLSEKSDEYFNMNMDYDEKAEDIYNELNEKDIREYIDHAFLA